MGKPKRTRGKEKKGVAVPVYDSDDERTYEREEVPDPSSSAYFEDEISEFHGEREKILLDQGAPLDPAGFSSDEQEEVLGLGSSSDDDEEEEDLKQKFRQVKTQGLQEDMASDIDEEADDLPDDKAWGHGRSKFYGADFSDEDIGSLESSEEGDAEMEEKEARLIQQRMLEMMDTNLQLQIPTRLPDSDVTETRLEKDISKMSNKDKLKMLRKESPELLDLLEAYKVKMAEVQDRLLPLYTLIQEGKLPPGHGAQYIKTKLRLNLNYCINLSFYVFLKARRTPVANHPVIGRLVQYRKLLEELEGVDEKMEEQIQEVLDKLERGEEFPLIEQPTEEQPKFTSKIRLTGKKTGRQAEKRKLSQLVSESEDEDETEAVPTGGRSKGRKKKRDEGRYETKDEQAALDYYDMMKGGHHGDQEAVPVEGEEGEESRLEVEGGGDGVEEYGEDGEKRGITYQISKNKGLTPHRKREQRNPRVKHRLKYRKAKIRRRGQHREVRAETVRYGGEISGIRAGIKRGIKLK